MKREIVLFFCLLVVLVTFAQGTKYMGQVLDANGTPLVNASVLLLNSKGKTVKFAKTDSYGRFSLAAPEGKEVGKIAFVCLGYARQDLPIDIFAKGNKTVKMQEKSLEIQEVEVKPEIFKIKGDTIAYSVLGLREKQDRTIEDVISRIPGVRVDVAGRILYRGKEINTFYVDGKNMAGDAYAMLTKNLSADKVDSVEVLQHHQPVVSLRDKKFSEAAAINLVLKPGAKFRWTGALELGCGMFLQNPWHWTRKARLVEMYFGNKMQAITMYKHNNVAENMSSEVSSVGVNDISSGPLDNLLSIGEGKYGFNNSHLLATNWFFKTGKSSQARFQSSWLWDKSTSHSYSEQTFFDVGNGAVMAQDRSASAYANQWKTSFEYSLNAANIRICNRLACDLGFDHSCSLTTLNGKEINERVLPRKRSLSDGLSIDLPSTVGFNSLYVGFTHEYLPGRLLLYNGEDEQVNLKTNSWRTQYTKSFLLSGNIHLSIMAGSDMERKNEFVSYNDTTASVKYKEDRFFLSPWLQFSHKKIELRIDAPVMWLSRRIVSDKDQRWAVEPSARLCWTMNSFWNWDGSYKHTFTPTGFETVNPLRIYTSYNMASSGNGINNHSEGDAFSTNLRYDNPGFGWNTDIGYSYTTEHFNTLYESGMVDGVYVRHSVDQTSRSTSQAVRGNIGRSSRVMRTNINLSCSYSWSDSYIMYQGQKTKSDMSTFVASLSWKMRPWRIFNFEEQSSFSINRQSSVGASNIFRNFSHRLKLFLQPGLYQLSMTNECLHSPDGSEKFSFYSDASLSYKNQKYELMLTCRNLWGTNKREYRYMSVMGTTYSVTELRPREILATITFNI